MSCYEGLQSVDPIFNVILTYHGKEQNNELYIFFGERKMSAAVQRLFNNEILISKTIILYSILSGLNIIRGPKYI